MWNGISNVAKTVEETTGGLCTGFSMHESMLTCILSI